LGELFGPLQGFDAATEQEFEAALLQSLSCRNMPSIINVHLAADDTSSAMRRLAEHLKSKVQGES
jgi:indolepyruvate decarboxylase